MADTDDTATLKYPGGEIDLQIVRATEGADGIALGSLLSKTGYTTFDNGFVNTAACKSSITYIDGDAGILRYRGYPIEQLAEKSTFIEVSYLLIYGELPTREQLAEFTHQIQRHTMLHEDLKRFFDGFPRNAHPMPVLSSVVGAVERSTRIRWTRSTTSRSSCRPSGCWPSCPPSPPTPTRSRSASRSCTRTTRWPGGELPADDVRVAGRALRRRPRGGARAGPAVHPARRPRAELLDVDGAAGRLVAGQPVRLDLRRHQRAVGPAARRGQPGGARDARADPRRAAATSASSSAR